MDKKSKNTMGFLKNELNTLRQADRTNVLIIKELQAIVSRVDDVKGLATYLYNNQPDCLSAITRERRAEACFDIASTLHSRLKGKT